MHYYKPMHLNDRKKRYSENRWKLENGDFVLAPTNGSVGIYGTYEILILGRALIDYVTSAIEVLRVTQ